MWWDPNIKRTTKDALACRKLDEAIFRYNNPWQGGCACPGGPPPFGCGCAEARYVEANAVVAGLTIISVLKFKGCQDDNAMKERRINDTEISASESESESAKTVSTDSLLSCLSALTGPSREIDVAIYRAVIEPLAEPFKEYIGSVWIGANSSIRVPRYTESIDAALTLVPKGIGWGITKFADYFIGNVGTLYYAEHPNPAIALVIAYLKAIANSNA